MHTKRWWQESSVIDELFHHSTSFELIQSVRLMRNTPYVKQHRFWADAFQFESSLNLKFPTSEIESLKISDSKIELINLMVGLTGIQGAFPYVYTNKIRQAPRAYRNEAQKFIGLFNHKLVSQYIDASLAYNLPIKYEINEENHYLDIVHALNGYTVKDEDKKTQFEHYFAEFSGLMQGQNNNSHALNKVLKAIFHPSIDVKEFVEEQFQLEKDQRTILSSKNSHMQLGVNTFCGEYITQIGDKVEITIGPLSYEDYLDYLPSKAQSLKLKSILQQWCSPTLKVDLRLILDQQSIKPLQLNMTDSIGLGWGASLMADHFSDNEETCYTLLGDVEC